MTAKERAASSGKRQPTLFLSSFFGMAAVLAGLLALSAILTPQTAFALDIPKALPVGIMAAKKQSVTIADNLPGRLDASKNAVVRARVTGIVEKRLFKEGSYVKQGEPLFRIDDRTFRATLQSAQGSLNRAIAQKKLNEANVARYRKLVKSNAISRQALDQAEASLSTSMADIEIARAAVTQAKINLEYCTVTAPISGYIGKQEVTVGALVSANTATEMANIRQIDPLYVNIQQSASKILRLKKMMAEKAAADSGESAAQVKIFLDDGTPYPHSGSLIFTDVVVDEATGEATVRASVPNPDNFLMPGLYVRVEVPQLTLDDVFLIPQQAVSRSEKGDLLFVAVPDPKAPQEEGKPPLSLYQPRPVQIARSQGDNWIITGGIEEGEQVIVDGMIKVQMLHVPHVIAMPWNMKTPMPGAPGAGGKQGSGAEAQAEKH